MDAPDGNVLVQACVHRCVANCRERPLLCAVKQQLIVSMYIQRASPVMEGAPGEGALSTDGRWPAHAAAVPHAIDHALHCACPCFSRLCTGWSKSPVVSSPTS